MEFEMDMLYTKVVCVLSEIQIGQIVSRAIVSSMDIKKVKLKEDEFSNLIQVDNTNKIKSGNWELAYIIGHT